MYLGLTSLGLRPAPFAASPITQLFQSGEPGAVFIAQKPSDLLVRRNLLTYSQDFSNAVWSKSGSAVSSGFTAPDGSFTAYKLTESATTASHQLLYSFPATPTVGQYVGQSVYLKAAERGYAFVGWQNGTLFYFAVIDLTTGVATTAVDAGGVAQFTCNSESVGNGWWRVKCTALVNGTGLVFDIRTSTDGVWANRSYTGNGTSGIYVWGAQLERGPVTTYQPVTDWTTEYLAAVGNLITQYSDNAGTTPVLNLEETVGLHLDTRPIFLGPELVTNGRFATDLSGWTQTFLPGTGTSAITWSAGGAVVTPDGTNRAYLSAPVALRVGARYRAAFKINGPGINVQVGSTPTAGDVVPGSVYGSSTDSQSLEFVATGATGYLTFQKVAASSTTIDDVSVREVISAPNTVGQPLRGPQVWDNANTTFSGSASQVSPGVYRILSTDGTISAVFSNSGPARMLNGAWYEATFNIDSVTTAGAGLTVDSGLGGGPNIPATVGPKRCIFQSVGTPFASIKRAGGITDIQISNLQFRQVYGNHRSQSSSGARPRLSARYNKCTNRNANPTDLTGMTLTNATNGLTTLSVVNDSAALTAAGLSNRCTLGNVYKLDNSLGDSTAFAAFPGAVGTTNTTLISVYARGSGMFNPRLNSSTVTSTTLTANYVQYSALPVPPSATDVMRINAAAGTVVYFILNDMRESCYSYLPTPQVVWDATTGYDDAGFPARLVYSGAQGMVTGAIDFSAFQQAQVFAGLSKLVGSDSTYRTFVDLTADPAATNGGFTLGCSTAISDGLRRTWGAFMRTGTAQVGKGISIYEAEVDVMSVQYDSTQLNAANEIKLYRNGVAVAYTADPGDSGTGTFANDALYFGNRGGSVVVNPYIGDEFISIVRGGSTPVTGTIYQIEQTCGRYMGVNI